MEENRFSLPHADKVFDALRRGKHISPADDEIYAALAHHPEDFRLLFKALGFELCTHPRGFYYFKGGDSLSDKITKIAVFMFILIDHLAGADIDIEDALIGGRIFREEEMPHETTDRYANYMKEAGGATVKACLGTLELLRFLDYTDAGGTSFRFRLPVYRFLDVCLEALETQRHLAEKESKQQGAQEDNG